MRPSRAASDTLGAREDTGMPKKPGMTYGKHYGKKGMKKKAGGGGKKKMSYGKKGGGYKKK
jgi:hypothetical protein